MKVTVTQGIRVVCDDRVYTGGETIDVPIQVADQWREWGWVDRDGLPDARGLTHPSGYTTGVGAEPDREPESASADEQAEAAPKAKVRRARRDPRVKRSADAGE